MYTGLGWSLDNLIQQSVKKHSEQVCWAVGNYTVELAFVLTEDEEIVKHEIVLLEVMSLVTAVKSCEVLVLETQGGRTALKEVKHLVHFQLVTQLPLHQVKLQQDQAYEMLLKEPQCLQKRS